MAEAELGDDVYGEDPTVRRLEEMAAERMGKEAAVLVASGTMGNLTSLLAHCGRGDEAIVGDEASLREQLQGFADAGVSDFSVACFPAEEGAVERTTEFLVSVLGEFGG